jgi:hypothetical protein
MRLRAPRVRPLFFHSVVPLRFVGADNRAFCLIRLSGFIVVKDEVGFSQNDIEDLTNTYCMAYQNWRTSSTFLWPLPPPPPSRRSLSAPSHTCAEGPIRVPAPVMYSHKLAYFFGKHVNPISLRTGTLPSTPSLPIDSVLRSHGGCLCRCVGRIQPRFDRALVLPVTKPPTRPSALESAAFFCFCASLHLRRLLQRLCAAAPLFLVILLPP